MGRTLVLASILATLVGLASCEMELQLLHVLFRHGDKVPHREYQNYPNDPHGNHTFLPVDNGDLTNAGKMREFKIGLMLRQRYNRFFGPEYYPSMIEARSTEVPRTQLSLQLVLAGLFSEITQRQNWNPRLSWLPSFVYFVPAEKDNLLFPHYCPLYKTEYVQFLQQPNVQQIINRYRDIMIYLTEHSGKLINSTSGVYYLYNLLKEEAAQNLTLPEWTKKVYPEPMREITALDFNLRSYTTNLRRLNGGILLRKIIEDIEELRADSLFPKGRKAFFYSAHELNVVAFARLIGFDKPVLPQYGSTFMLETYRNERDRYFVKVLFYSGDSDDLTPMKIPGCTEYCQYEKFLNLLKSVTPDDDEYRCRTKLPSKEEVVYETSASGSIDDRILSLVLSFFIFHFLM